MKAFLSVFNIVKFSTLTISLCFWYHATEDNLFKESYRSPNPALAFIALNKA